MFYNAEIQPTLAKTVSLISRSWIKTTAVYLTQIMPRRLSHLGIFFSKLKNGAKLFYKIYQYFSVLILKVVSLYGVIITISIEEIKHAFPHYAEVI